MNRMRRNSDGFYGKGARGVQASVLACLALACICSAVQVADPCPANGEDNSFNFGPPNNWAFEFVGNFDRRDLTLFDFPGIVVLADAHWIVKNEIFYSSQSPSTSPRAQTFYLHIFDSKTLKHVASLHGPNFVRHVAATEDGKSIFALVGEYIGEDPHIIGPPLALLAISPASRELELAKVNVPAHFITCNQSTVLLSVAGRAESFRTSKFVSKPFSSLTIAAVSSDLAAQIESGGVPSNSLGDFSLGGLEYLGSLETTSLIGSAQDGSNNYQGKYEANPPVLRSRAKSNAIGFDRLKVARQMWSDGANRFVCRVFDALNLSASNAESSLAKKKLVGLDDSDQPIWEGKLHLTDGRYFWLGSQNKSGVEVVVTTRHDKAGGVAKVSLLDPDTSKCTKLPLEIHYKGGEPTISLAPKSGKWTAFVTPHIYSEYDLASLVLCNLETGKLYLVDTRVDASATYNGFLRVKENSDESVTILCSSDAQTMMLRVTPDNVDESRTSEFLDPERPYLSKIKPPMIIKRGEKVASWPSGAVFDDSGQMLYVKLQDGFSAYKLGNLGSPTKVFDVFLDGNGGYAVLLANGLFAGSPGSETSILNKHCEGQVSPSALSPWRNRPAEVIKALGGDEKAIEPLQKATERWLAKIGNPERAPEPRDEEMPRLELAENVPLWADKNGVMIRYRATAAEAVRSGIMGAFGTLIGGGGAAIDRLLVRVNGVEQAGAAQVPGSADDWSHEVKLAEGQNWIEASAIDARGVASNVVRFRILLPKSEKPVRRFVVALGVSNYQRESMNLAYAAKDAGDVAATLRDSSDNAQILVMLNDDVTKSSLAQISKFLEPAQENDEVVVFCAGHGMLDQNLEYVFAGHDFDPERPSKTGIKLDDLIGAISKSKSLKRLLLMDTCHAGLVGEKDEMLLAQSGANLPSGVRAISKRGMAVKPVAGLSFEGQQRFIEELFSLPGSHRGINIIGASGGAEFALESEQWNNGVFTSALIEAVRNKKADLNSDNRITVEELRDFLGQRVSQLTKGAQKPSVVAFEKDQTFDIIYARNDKREASRAVSKAGVPPASVGDAWLFPDSSERLLVKEELAQLTADNLWRARNEIFARKGFIFQTARGKAFAASLGSAYSPLSADQEEIRSRMNATEKANIKMIQVLETEK
jgi:hypothetical protein